MSVTPHSGVAPPPRILVASDDVGARALLSAALRPLPAAVVEAGAGEAVRLLGRDRFAFGVVDDGVALHQTRDVPLIFVGDGDSAARAWQLGAAEVLPRPVDADALRARGRLLLRLYEAEAADREKDDLLAMVSHELRTPLNAILGWAEALLHGKLPAERLQHGLDTIARNARVQARLVEDLLDTSRIIAGKLALARAPVDAAQVARRAAETVAPMAAVKNVGLEVVIEPGEHDVDGDGARLQQVIWNVLANAVKFSPPGTHVELTARRRDERVEVMVRDNGAGIAPELLPHVFERFRQGVEVGARRHGGLGLGLAIARGIVELHGGTIDAASDGPGRGSTFTLALPARRRDDAAPRLPVEAEGSARHTMPMQTITPLPPARLDGLRVLFVDDEADARELLTMVLADAGAEVRTAASAAEALDLVRDERFDVMVSDIGMPGEDGYSLMRKVAMRARLPGIALSAFTSQQDRERALDAGFVTHLAKPLDAPALIAFVHRLARR